jgi:type IX secretion system substrate protein
MRPSRLAWLLAALVLLAWLAPAPRSGRERRPRGIEPLSIGIGDDADAQAEMEFQMLRDPRMNSVPRGIHQRELALARTLPLVGLRVFGSGQGPARVQQVLPWTERGPNNVGGRTRAFAVDVANPTTLIAGSVAGGMWKSIDDGASWSLKTGANQLHGMTCVAQDRRAGHTATWYAGTGEIRGSTNNDTRWGSLYRGDGIFKSVDGGESWSLLPATSSGTPQATNDFDYVIDVATNPANAIQDEVYAATYDGIWRSVDGGTSWIKSIASDSGFTDVAVTQTGVVYAATRSAGLLRLWRSPNGTTWTAIVGPSFPTVANRMVVGLAPSNPSVVYWFFQGVNTAPAVGGHQLWKYTYLSGDGSGAGGTWANRGGNLPADINTQAGYDMLVHVKPDDENFVILGGTNLYRSTTGFASADGVTIGGYPFYPAGQHHPDLHAGAFSPASSTVYYSAGDGGISKANDITLGSMVWTTLNHGYDVTQFYSVSLEPDAGTNLLLAGAQDNGTRLGNAPGASDWSLAYGGDGTIVEVSPAVDNQLYMQWQGGHLQRSNYDGSNLVEEIQPTGSMNQMFVNPILLDPNNSSILYYAGGVSTTSSRIWRNDAIQVTSAGTGWSNLAATEVGAGSGYLRQISALGVSTLNEPNVLYYGTNDGLVMKARFANTASPVVTNVTPPGLNGGTAIGGFVRCIAVDPNDGNRALLCFGNYNFQSLWYTVDGGGTWTDVEGNLAGPSGPSIRHAAMFYVGGQLQVFLGTSIGVLSTSALAGGATVWSQEAASEIGNVIIGWLDYRSSDRTLAVGTHGRGVFTTQFNPTTGIAGPPAAARDGLRLAQSYPNPARDQATIAYELPRAGEVSLRLYDVSGRAVRTLVQGTQERGPHQVRLSTAGLPSGAYTYVLRAGGETRRRTLLLGH